MLQYKEISFQMLASAFPELLAPYLEFSERIKVEGNIIFLIILIMCISEVLTIIFHTKKLCNFYAKVWAPLTACCALSWFFSGSSDMGTSKQVE